MTREKLSKQELSKKNAVGISVNPIYAYTEHHWSRTGSQGSCPAGEEEIICAAGGSTFCDLSATGCA